MALFLQEGGSASCSYWVLALRGTNPLRSCHPLLMWVVIEKTGLILPYAITVGMLSIRLKDESFIILVGLKTVPHSAGNS
ncbi:hypothetical protein VNO77_15281 [Canavalia gladiata]|uniref:Uncharacterized protein n=1 Tax=Canavalia gladiata TaxID=3824 RepID=A0AAN9LZE0_CANGL